LDILCADQTKYLGDLRRLIFEVSNMNSFSHLLCLEDGNKKASRAKNAVEALQKIVSTHDNKINEEKIISEKRKEYAEKLNNSKAVKEKLDEIKNEFFELVGSSDAQSRGFKLEKILYDIFDLFDLDPKASFRNLGEQIDGSFTLDGTDYLFEAKWKQQPSNAADLDAFSSKVKRKLENTLGLFLSINGFSKESVKLYSQSKSAIILLDGSDLMAVLEGRIDLVTLLIRKRRHASQTGEILLKVNDIL